MATIKKLKIPSSKVKLPKLPKIKPLPKIKTSYVGVPKMPKIKMPKIKIF